MIVSVVPAPKAFVFSPIPAAPTTSANTKPSATTATAIRRRCAPTTTRASPHPAGPGPGSGHALHNEGWRLLGRGSFGGLLCNGVFDAREAVTRRHSRGGEYSDTATRNERVRPGWIASGSESPG